MLIYFFFKKIRVDLPNLCVLISKRILDFKTMIPGFIINDSLLPLLKWLNATQRVGFFFFNIWLSVLISYTFLTINFIMYIENIYILKKTFYTLLPISSLQNNSSQTTNCFFLVFFGYMDNIFLINWFILYNKMYNSPVLCFKAEEIRSFE
jgi:hypothetical protein